jgi:CHAT domain
MANVVPQSPPPFDYSRAKPAPSRAAPALTKQVKQVEVERYPMMDAPDAVAPEQDFLIQVSLTEQQLSPGLQILNGEAAGGKVGFSLSSTAENSWPIEVDLMAPGMEFTRGTTPDNSIVLPLHGNATVATFWVKAGPTAAKLGTVPLLASFFYHRDFLARIQRDIKIKGSTAAPDAGPPPARRTVKTTGAVQDISAELNTPPVAPDLTVIITGKGIEVTSPYFVHPVLGTMPEMTGFPHWLAQHAPVSAGRGTKLLNDGSEPHGGALGFGQELYDHYAPEVFKKAFWTLFDNHRASFRTIQIYSDNPDIPWEFMEPVRDNGRDRQPFIGLSYSIARWDMNDQIREHPPFTEIMEKTFVVAPNYSVSRKLEAEVNETQALAKLEGYSPVNGNMSAMKELFRNSPRGIVHFAGHGKFDETRGNYEILLEDGALDTDSWRSMAPDDPGSQTFFFFNACDVGQAKLAGNFVDGWGPAVLGKGASGYIGALFPVDDQVAANFSIYFYKLLHDQMKNGPADVSAILEQTRRDVYASTNNPTALAYVLYGDTNLKFVKAAKAHDCSIDGEVPSYLNLAENNRSNGKYERAISEYTLVLGCEPGNRQALEGLQKAKTADALRPR